MSLDQIARRGSGTHGRIIDTCPTEWGQWMIGFLDRAFPLPAGDRTWPAPATRPLAARELHQ